MRACRRQLQCNMARRALRDAGRPTGLLVLHEGLA
jgi:hypothetical protein